MAIPYQLVRSSRKTIGIQVRQERVVVHAPLHTSEETIKRYVYENKNWIQKQLAKNAALQNRAEAQGILSEDDIAELAAKAKQILPDRVAHYAKTIGVTYGRITIRRQHTKWGSCSSKGNLNFNCLIMLAPIEVIDSVIVHELCHRKEMNHSERFYAEVYKAYPAYDPSSRPICRRCSRRTRRKFSSTMCFRQSRQSRRIWVSS